MQIKKVLACALLIGCATASWAANYSGVFVFGDSLSDTGNAAVLVGSNAGQVVTGNTYIPSQPYGSGQFTNGDVWVKSFTSALGLSSSGAPSLTGGGTFAYGGARIATDGAGQPPSLSAQATQFLGQVGGSAPNQALYVVAGGGNDARDLLAATAASATPAAVLAEGATAYAQAVGQVVDRLQTAGAHNIVVWDVPNVGLAPVVQSLGPAASALGSQVAFAMNLALSVRLSLEAGVSLFDVYGLQSAVVANPGAYGFSNVSDACGAVAGCDGSGYLFWDGLHPTQAGHSVLAQGMLDTIAAPVPEPASAALFTGGLLLAAVRARRQRRSA